MGEMADMILDSVDFWDEPDGIYEHKPLKCRGCGNKGLEWRKIEGIWTMMEIDGGVHTCEKYSPPIDVLKFLAKEVTKKTKEDNLWRLRERMRGPSGITQLVKTISDSDLIDLYTSFVRDDQRYYDDPPIGISFGYSREVELLKKELLRRLNK